MKNKKKIIYILIILSIIILIVFKLNVNKTEKTYKYDIAISSYGKISTFKLNKDNNLELLEEKSDLKKENIFLWYDLYKYKDNYISKTTYEETTTFIAKTNTKTLNTVYNDHRKQDIFSYCIDKEYFYSTSVFLDKIIISKYNNENLEFEKENIIKTEKEKIVSKDIVEKDNFLYILIYKKDIKNNNKNFIWKINKKSLEIEKEIDIKEEGYISRIIIKDNNIYMTKTYNKYINSNNIEAGNEIIILNIDNNNKESIKLDNYPSEIYLDENKLIIHHDTKSIKKELWSIINTEQKNVENKIEFKEEHNKEHYRMPFFNKDKKNYYFLFSETIYIYDKKEKKINNINLEKFKINYAHAILREKDD